MSQPTGFPGRRDATNAPTGARLSELIVFSSQ